MVVKSGIQEGGREGREGEEREWRGIPVRRAPPPPEKVEWGVPPWIEGDEKRLVDALALALGAKVHVALGERGGRLAPEAGGGPDEELSALQSRCGSGGGGGPCQNWKSGREGRGDS